MIGWNHLRQWIKNKPEDINLFRLMFDLVNENPDLYIQVRDLLNEMIQKGSETAAITLGILPVTVQGLLAAADGHYYAAEYEDAILLYRQVLKKEPDNQRAKDHLAKAELKRIAGETVTGVPRIAEQYYRRARSFISARDISTAMNFLSAAIEAAREQGMRYFEAEDALDKMYDLLTADEFKRDAENLLEKEQWDDALDLYQKALTLDPTNVEIKKEFESLQGLLKTESELRKKGFKKYILSTSEWQNTFKTAKSVLDRNNSLLNFIDRQLIG